MTTSDEPPVYMGAASVHPTTDDEEAVKVVTDALLRYHGDPIYPPEVEDIEKQADEAAAALRRAGFCMERHDENA